MYGSRWSICGLVMGVGICIFIQSPSQINSSLTLHRIDIVNQYSARITPLAIYPVFRVRCVANLRFVFLFKRGPASLQFRSSEEELPCRKTSHNAAATNSLKNGHSYRLSLIC